MKTRALLGVLTAGLILVAHVAPVRAQVIRVGPVLQGDVDCFHLAGPVFRKST